jgi:hypothetical protein
MCDVCEKWIPWAGKHGVRKDLFSFIDLIALDPSRGIIGVQCCSRSGHAAHRRKILEECTELAMEWLKCGGKVEIWSWAKQVVKRGGKAMRWTPKVEEITLASWGLSEEELGE